MTAHELKLDYFKFYDVENRDLSVDVTLQGQFEKRPVRMGLRLLDFFANPVSKNGEPMYDKAAHLAWYRGIQPTEPARRVVLENQFGKFEIRIGPCYGLLVPSQKVETGSVFPKGLDHYKVYRLLTVLEEPPKVLKLRDQFGSEEVKLMLPLYFAVPVTKRVGARTFPIQNERAHLLIYSITNRVLQKTIKLQNQFTRGATVQVIRSLMLGAPSVKLEWKPL